jgi:arsenite-transporting ATPase
LLDAAGSYHRETARQLGDSMSFITPLMRLQDPVATKLVIVTLAEPTPVTEAAELQRELNFAGITPFAWVINNSLAAATPTNPFLQLRAENKCEQIDIVRSLCARVAVVPMLAEEPVGVRLLARLTLTSQALTAAE